MTAGTLDITIEQGSDFELNLYVGIGYRMPIASFSDAGGGLVKATTSLVHGLSTDDRVVIQGSTYYSGTYQVTVVDTTSFTFEAVWEATETAAHWVHPRDLSGYTARAMLRMAYDDTTPTATFDSSIPDALGGHIKIALGNTITTALPRIRKSYWDLEIVDASDFVERLLQGKAVVTPEVTK